MAFPLPPPPPRAPRIVPYGCVKEGWGNPSPRGPVPVLTPRTAGTSPRAPPAERRSAEAAPAEPRRSAWTERAVGGRHSAAARPANRPACSVLPGRSSPRSARPPPYRYRRPRPHVHGPVPVRWDPPQPRETGRLAAPPPRSPWPGPLPVRSGARRPGGGGARRNAAPPPPAGTAGQRPGPPLPPRGPSAPRRAPGSARSLLKPRVYGKPLRLGTNNSTRFERRCFISRAQRGAEPLYLTFFLGRRLLVWPHFFLRQLMARGWRRA